MGSPAYNPQKRNSKASDSSHVSMTTSTVEDDPIETRFFGWLRVFRFASLLCRTE